MRWGRWLLITLACLVCVGGIIAARYAAREPEYQGRKLSQWLDETVYPEQVLSPGAQLAVRQIGADAIPSLLRWVAYEPSPFRKIGLSLLVRFRAASISNLRDQRMLRALQAQAAFFYLGSTASSAVPELARLSGTSRDRFAAIRCLQALTSIGPDSVPGLIEIISTPNARVRDFAIFSLPQFGVAARPAIPVLIGCLQDKDPRVAIAAASVLGDLGMGASTVIPALNAALQNTNSGVRSAAAGSLARFVQPTVPAAQ